VSTDGAGANDLLRFEEQRPTQASAEKCGDVLQGGAEKLNSRRVLTPQSKCIISILHVELLLDVLLSVGAKHKCLRLGLWLFRADS